MRKRTIKKQFWFNEEEQLALKTLARLANMNESEIIRKLVLGYKLKEKPDDRFYDNLKVLRSLANNMNQITKKAHSLGFIDELAYKKNADMVIKFIEELKDEYLKERRGGNK